MTTDEVNFNSLITSQASSSFNFELDHDKELSSLSYDDEDLFPDPPKFIPESEQTSSNAAEFSFVDEQSKSSLSELVGIDNDTFIHTIEDNSCSNISSGQLSNNGRIDHIVEDNNTKCNPSKLYNEKNYNSTCEVLDNTKDTKEQNLKMCPPPVLTENQSFLSLKTNHDIKSPIRNHPTANNIDSSAHLDNVGTIKHEDKNLYRALGTANLPAASPSLSLSSYYSSAESVTSEAPTKKKKKRNCNTCDIHFKHTRDLLKHLKKHVSLPTVDVTKLNESNPFYMEFLKRQQQLRQEQSRQEQPLSPSDTEQNGGLKLKLKLSASQSFEVVPIDKIKKSSSPPVHPPTSNGSSNNDEKSKKVGGIRVLRADEIKMSPPSSPSLTSIESMNLSTPLNPLFECPTFDSLSDQFTEDPAQEAADDLLKKLLENNNSQYQPETDWTPNTNEFISIDRLAHMCSSCHKAFASSMALYHHKRVTGHEFHNPMHPPPPPKRDMNIPNQMMSSARMPYHSSQLQMSSNQAYPPSHSQLMQHLTHHSHHPQQHPTAAQMNAMGLRTGYPPGYHPSQQPGQRYSPALPPGYSQQAPQMMVRRPPPLYRVPSPGAPPYGDMGMHSDMYSNAMMNGPLGPPPGQNSNICPGAYPNGQMNNLARQPMFLKARLQRTILPKTENPSNSHSPPAVLSAQQVTRPKFLSTIPSNGPSMLNPQLNHHLLENSRPNSNPSPNIANNLFIDGPPIKKIKREPEDCEIVETIKGSSSPVLEDGLEKTRDSLQLNDQITLSLKNKESNKNPKEVANMLAYRGITVTHKPKLNAEEPLKNALAQEAVQKLQLNNSVSIITKKKNDSNKNGNEINSDANTTKSMTKASDSPFLSCPISDCDDKFLTQDSLNRHTQRMHRMAVPPVGSHQLPTNNSSVSKNLKVFRCKVCPALFSTPEGLLDHQRRHHRLIKTSADELGIPIIDLRNEQTKQKLASLGIINYIPLSTKSANGCFGFPIVSVQGASNPNVCNVLGMGVNSLLSLGPIKPIQTTRKNDS